MFIRLTLLLIGTLILTAAPNEEARGTRWRLESQAAAATADGKDAKARIEAFSKLHADFPENARVLRNLSWAEQRGGNLASAENSLKQYAAMGMTLEAGGPIYASMLASGLLDKVPEIARNRSVITHGTQVCDVPDPDLLVEDIAFDPLSGRYLLTSVRKRKIVSCDSTGKCRDIVSSSSANELDGMLAIHVDAQRKWLWATTVAMPMEEAFRPERKGESALLKFDLTSFRLLKRYELNDGREHAFGDMTVASNGDAYVSDGAAGDVYVVKHDRNELEPVVSPGVFVSPQTPTLNKSQSLLYVPDYALGIAVIELSTKKVEWIKAAAPVALEGIDGLYWTEAGLIATQNGTLPERVVRFHLREPDVTDSFTVIEANWPGLGDPTHGVGVGGFFYFIVNSGWDRVGEDGKSFRSGSPAQIWRVPLKS
jgi:hypothetical protein